MESLNLQSPMNALCRTCLKANNKFTSIFSQVNDQRTVKEMLVDCTAIEVETNDDLPKNICSDCLKILTLAFNFKAMAKDCNTRLCNIRQAFLQDPDDVQIRPLEIKMSIEIGPTVVVPDKPWTDEGDYVDNVVADSCVSGSVNKEADENIIVKKEDTVNLLVLADHSESENALDNNINEKSTDFFSDPQDQLNNSPNCETTEPELTSSPINVHKDIDNFTYDNQGIEKETPASELGKQKIKKINFKSRERYREKIICEYCNQLFQFRYFVDVHIHTHTGNVPHKCDDCGKRFPKRSILNKHKQLHVDTKSHQCNVCGKTFANSSNLWRHQRIHAEQKRYKCDVCNKAFKVREILKQHKMTHNMEKSICDICGKTFISSSGLYLHMFTHNNENLKCPECDKVFANKIYLQRHVRRHSRAKSHACDKCDKSFSLKSLLHHHSLIHTGEKPFSCEICGKTFRQKNCISRHMRTHTGETPYSCEKCPSQFRYSHHLVNHMKSHK